MIDFSSYVVEAVQSTEGTGLAEGTTASCFPPKEGEGDLEGGEGTVAPLEQGEETGEGAVAPLEQGEEATVTRSEQGEEAAGKPKTDKGSTAKRAPSAFYTKRLPSAFLLGAGIGFVVAGAVEAVYFGVAARRGIDPKEFKAVFSTDVKVIEGARTLASHAKELEIELREYDEALKTVEEAEGKLGATRAEEAAEPMKAAKAAPAADLEDARAAAAAKGAEVEERVKAIVEKAEANKVDLGPDSKVKSLQDDLAWVKSELRSTRKIREILGGYLSPATGTAKMSAAAAAAAAAGTTSAPAKRGFFADFRERFKQPTTVVGDDVRKLDTTTPLKRFGGPAMAIVAMVAGGAMIAAGASGVGAQLAGGTGSCGNYASLALSWETQLKADLDALYAAEGVLP